MGHDAILQVRADREITGDEARSVGRLSGNTVAEQTMSFLMLSGGLMSIFQMCPVQGMQRLGS